MEKFISKGDLPLTFFNDTENSLMVEVIDRAEYIIKKFKPTDGILKPFPTIKVFIEKESQLNAKAIPFPDGTYGISLSYGAVVILTDLFTRMLSYRDVFSEIGSSTKELHNKPTLNDFVDDVKSLIDFDKFGEEDKFNWIIPQDETRQQFSKFLFIKAIDFLILHELYHILNGHLDFLNEGRPQTVLAEDYYQKNTDKTLLLTKKTLEMDADCCACCSIVHKTFSDSHSFIGILSSPREFQQFNKDFNIAMAYTTFAIYSLFRITACNDYDETNHDFYSHSTPRQRQLGFISTADRYIKERLIPKLGTDAFLIDITKITETTFKKTFECEVLYTLLTGKSPDRTKFPFTFKPTKLATELIDEWNRIHPALVKHAFRKIPGIEVATSNENKVVKKVGKNDLCDCGSGEKYKKCHGK
jgi:hypothetical protein